MATQTQEQTKQKAEECLDNPVGWFEMPVTDMERAKKFYTAVFGYQFDMLKAPGGPFQMAMFPMAPHGKGSAGALMKGDGYTPSHEGAMVYFSVPAIESALGNVAQNGGKVLRPKASIGQYGYMAIFQDSEGNRAALHSLT